MSTLKFVVFVVLFLTLSSSESMGKPRVFIFTDINIDSGDPDDRQSLIHLLWYANELSIEGIVPDRWDANGYEACEMVLEAYSADYSTYAFGQKDYPHPDKIRGIIARNREDAFSLFPSAVSADDSLLYVLIWGNMDLFSSILLKDPEMARHIRVISIGTGLMLGEDIQYLPESWEKSPPCHQLNWNGKGRSKIYNDPLFDNLWWLEINWTYAGMFTGDGPVEMFGRLSKFGQMGKHMKEVVSSQSWAHYFRVGDTPSVLYVIDSGHDPDDPEQTSWAGKFVRPFPVKKPDYYTDYAGNVAWNYQNPCETWNNHQAVRDVGVSTLEERREEMYAALISKLKSIY